MTLEQLLEALGKLPEGLKFAEAIKSLIAAKEAEVTHHKGQFKTLTKTLKDTEDKLKNTTQRLEAFHDFTGVADDVEDLEAALNELKAKEAEALKTDGKNTPEIAQLQKDIVKLQRDLKKATELQAASEKTASEERAKRQNSERNRTLLGALTANKAIKPDQLIKILTDKVKINEDDSFVFLKDDGDEVEIDAGVKGWLESNPEFVFNPQNPGGGGGSGGSNNNKSTFAEAILKSGQTPERLHDAASHYFGGSK